MIIRKAELTDKVSIFQALDRFREDCIFQITGDIVESNYATNNIKTDYFEKYILNSNYICYLLFDETTLCGIITGYICPMLRIGKYRAEVEEFYIIPKYRGKDNANMLMDKFVSWAKDYGAVKVNLESDNEFIRAHGFYKNYRFVSKAKRFILEIR